VLTSLKGRYERSYTAVSESGNSASTA
jgi:hypothetical protein